MQKISIFGGVSFNTMVYVEHFPDPQPATHFLQKINETVGSTGAGKALNLCQLGFDVTLHAFIGDDFYGQQVRQILDQDHLNCAFEITPQGTERHVNLMSANGQRQSFMHQTAVNPKIDFERCEAIIAQSDIVVLNITNYCRNLIPLIQKHQKAIWCDIHDYDGQNDYHADFIQAADYLFLSSENLADYRDFMESMVEQGKTWVVCTHGDKGATGLTAEKQWIEVPALSGIEVLDTNGAGDSFFSGALYGFSQQHDFKKCLELGTRAAGLCIASPELASPLLSEQQLATG